MRACSNIYIILLLISHIVEHCTITCLSAWFSTLSYTGKWRRFNCNLLILTCFISFFFCFILFTFRLSTLLMSMWVTVLMPLLPSSSKFICISSSASMTRFLFISRDWFVSYFPGTELTLEFCCILLIWHRDLYEHKNLRLVKVSIINK